MTKNQALAPLRHFFDALVTRHAAPLNPFQSVRGRKHDTSDHKTPGLSIQQARNLLGSIDTSHVVGLRDRAMPGTLAWTGARVGAIARLRRGDLEDQGTQQVLRFRQKGGKQRETPAATTTSGLWFGRALALPAGRVSGCRIARKLSDTERECMRAGRPRSRVAPLPIALAPKAGVLLRSGSALPAEHARSLPIDPLGDMLRPP